jgi:hypothetical protein
MVGCQIQARWWSSRGEGGVEEHEGGEGYRGWSLQWLAAASVAVQRRCGEAGPVRLCRGGVMG